MRTLSYLTLFAAFLASCGSVKPYVKKGTQEPLPADTKVAHTLFLIGDDGAPKIETTDPVLKNLSSDLAQSENATLVFLGDNIYPHGLPEDSAEDREIAAKQLTTQLDVSASFNGKTIFIPGNHDWDHWRKEGLASINRQEVFIRDYAKGKDISLIPQKGCAGPVEVPLNDSVILLIVDTQWWLHQYEKNVNPDSCNEVTNDVTFLEAIDDALTRNADKQVIMMGHHPLVSNGLHGGHFPIKDHLFPLHSLNKNLWIPLPGLGSIYPFYRKYFGHIQDIPHPRYKALRNALFNLFEKHGSVIYACGHEHSLQYHELPHLQHIMSGAGCKNTYARRGIKKAQFTHQSTGYAQLDFMTNGELWLQYTSVDEAGNATKTFTKKLWSNTLKANQKTQNYPDSVEVIPGPNFKASGLKKTFMGSHYREAWQMPVKVPVLDLYKEAEGLTPLRKGGGMQTKSLRFKGGDGREYVIRLVEKFPAKALPPELRKTLAADVVKDQMSSAHPYGAFLIPDLAEAAGIYHTNPKLVFVPDDPKLKEYQKEFGGNLALFEERPSNSQMDQPFFGKADDIDGTLTVVDNLQEDHDNQVDQQFVLRSRLFDMLIGDWDRHDDQWKWAEFKSKKKSIYRPIPRDRDQVFYKTNGLFPSIANRKWAVRKFQNYDYKVRDIEGLNFNARYFDRSFLTEPTWEDWEKEIRFIQENITDEVIAQSFSFLPDSVRKNTQSVEEKLKYRREHLREMVEPYYKSLAKEVNIVTSDKAEKIKINRYTDSTKVRIWGLSKTKRKKKDKVYERVFLNSETRFINIYALGGDDIVELKNDTKNGIKIRIITGEGQDTIRDESQVAGLAKKTHIFDTKNTQVEKSSETRARLSDRPEVHAYDRKAFKYNSLMPLVDFGYNVDDGVFLGGGFLWTTHGFRKEPFASKQKLTGKIATQSAAFDFKYKGTFTDVFGKWDLDVLSTVFFPNFQFNYYGAGNESDRNEDLAGRFDRFYKTRMNQVNGVIGVKNKGISLGTKVEYTDLQNRFDRFINSTESSLQSSDFDPKRYVGFFANYAIEKVNDKNFPTRGVRLNYATDWLINANESSKHFAKLNTDMRLYFSVGNHRPVTFAYRLGGATNIGNYEFFQANFLSGTENVRGYNRNRFAGRSLAYHNVEARWKLADIKTYLFPAKLGLNTFWDAGRVWEDNENSNKLHHGLGGGFWAYLSKTLVIDFNYARSDDNNFILTNTRLFF